MALCDQAYGVPIHSKVCELADRQVNLGSVYVTLDRLQSKGYVASRVAEGLPRRGKPKRVYRLEPAGLRALEESVETAARVSESFYESSKVGKRRPKRTK